MMNKNWQRWIFASIGKHIKTACDTNDLKLYIEGSPRDTDKAEDWVELRIDGPTWTGGTQNEYRADEIEINVFIASKMNKQDNSRIHRNIGLINTILEGKIPVYKLGDGSDDDQSFVTCLQVKVDKERNKTKYLGQVNKQTELLRATVDVVYFGDFGL